MATTRSDAPHLCLRGGLVLLPEGRLEETDLTLAEGRILGVGEDVRDAETPVWDVRGLLVLPGLIDLHGDAFEQALMPRPGVRAPTDVALADNDRHMAVNGITTAYLSVTYSWEPGLRGRDTLLAVMAGVERLRDSLLCDTRLHLRFELYNLEAESDVIGWLQAGVLDLLSLNDHLEMITTRLDQAEKLAKYAERTGLDLAALRALITRVAARRAVVPDSVRRLCAAAARAGVPAASHDDESPDDRDHYRALGATLCEFPCNLATARAAVAAGDTIILGAPNVLFGGSHADRLRAQDAIAAGLCHVLTSDYYYPSLLEAPFRLLRAGVCDLAQAWRLVSSGPAEALGLSDRGRIAPGLRADLLLVDDSQPDRPRLVCAFLAGRPLMLGTMPIAGAARAELRLGEYQEWLSRCRKAT